MNQYFVIFSKEPYLLARFSMELQMEGYEMSDLYSDSWEESKWLCTYNNKTLGIWGFKACGVWGAIRLWLTEKNYLEVLGMVIK